MVGTTLTVVVPTIPGRESLLSRCLASLCWHGPTDAEIIVVEGTGPLGSKVNHAAGEAAGTYLTVVDDDDYVTEDYYDSVMPHLRQGVVDFVGLKIRELANGEPDGESETRGDLPTWGAAHEPHGPTPKGITRTSIWRQVPFGDDYKADRRWCKQVAPLIGSHVFIDRCLYVYDWYDSTSAFYQGGARYVGDWSLRGDPHVRRLRLDV